MSCRLLKRPKQLSAALHAVMVSALIAAGSQDPLLADLPAADQPLALSFELEDQFGDLYSNADFPAKRLILVGGDRAGRQGSQEWALAVGSMLETEVPLQGRPDVLRIADLRGVPGFLKRSVTRQLRKSLSTSLLLDWDGRVAGPYDFQPNLANVLLLDSDGAVLLQIESTRPRQEEIDELRDALVNPENPSRYEVTRTNRAVLLGSCL